MTVIALQEAAVEGWLAAGREMAITYGARVVGAILVLFAGWWLAGRLRDWTRRTLEQGKVDEALVPFLSSMAYAATIVLVGVTVLGVFGIPTASVVAVLGAAGLAVGLAFQGTLSNFAAGIMLLIFKPFDVGDFVEVAGVSGTVEGIRIFTTGISTGDNVQVTVPNSRVFGTELRNYTTNATRRIDLTVGVGYGDDLDVAERAIRDVLEAEDRLLEEPAPQVAVDSLGDSSVNFIVRPWVKTDDYWSTRRDLVRALKEQVEAAGCGFPYPSRDVYIVEGGD